MREQWAWASFSITRAPRGGRPGGHSGECFGARSVKADLRAVVFQGKLVKILDVESVGFSSHSEKKISLSEQKRQGQLSKHAQPLHPICDCSAVCPGG